jgi:hypothetical protein
MLLIYKEHLESYLVRDSANNGFANLVGVRNEIRLDLKGENRQLVTNDEDGSQDLMSTSCGRCWSTRCRSARLRLFATTSSRSTVYYRTLAAHVATNQILDNSDVAYSDALRRTLLAAIAIRYRSSRRRCCRGRNTAGA